MAYRRLHSGLGLTAPAGYTINNSGGVMTLDSNIPNMPPDGLAIVNRTTCAPPWYFNGVECIPVDGGAAVSVADSWTRYNAAVKVNPIAANAGLLPATAGQDPLAPQSPVSGSSTNSNPVNPTIPGGALPANPDLIDSAMSWVQNNPLMAAALGIGVLFLVVKR